MEKWRMILARVCEAVFLPLLFEVFFASLCIATASINYVFSILMLGGVFFWAGVGYTQLFHVIKQIEGEKNGAAGQVVREQKEAA